MLSLFPAVSLALLVQTITSLPALPSFDDAGLSADFGLESNQFSSVGTDPGPSFSSLDTPSSDNAEALLSQQPALSVDSSASAPPPTSQDDVSPDCDKSSKGKRETGGVETSCPAPFTNSSPGTTQQAPKTTPDGQKNRAPNGQMITTPKKPGRQGDLRFTPEEEPLRNQFGQKEQDPQCPGHYKHAVCGIADSRYDSWGTLYSLFDADLVINYGFGHGKIIRPGTKPISFLSKLPFTLTSFALTDNGT